MSEFLVSARKHRPLRFEDVVGQRHVTETLKNAIRNDKLAHAFLFCGPRGVGKTTCARILAKVLNCEKHTADIEPCGECGACRSFAQNASMNVIELDAASNNSVEQIRTLIEQVRFAPQSGEYKVFIIDEVHMLSTAAFNAFLKTLEEPPRHVKFILATTEKHKILPTILSRCQVFEFNRIDVKDMVAHLLNIAEREAINADNEALHIIALKADGGLRDALSIFDRIAGFNGGSAITYQSVVENLNILDYEYYFKLTEFLLTENLAEVLLTADAIRRKGFEGDLFMEGFAEHLRNLLVAQDERTLALLQAPESMTARYTQQAELCPKGWLLTLLGLANECDMQYKAARNKSLLIDSYLIKMTFAVRVLQTPLASNTAATSGDEKKKPELSEERGSAVSMVRQDAPSYQTVGKVRLFSETRATVRAEGLPSLKLGADKNATPPPLPLAEELPVFSLEAVQAYWLAFAKTLQSGNERHHFTQTRLSLAGNTLQATVESSLAENIIRNHSDFFIRLREHFQHKSLEFVITVAERPHTAWVEERVKPLNNNDKLERFFGVSPGLKPFLQALDVEIDRGGS